MLPLFGGSDYTKLLSGFAVHTLTGALIPILNSLDGKNSFDIVHTLDKVPETDNNNDFYRMHNMNWLASYLL